MDVAQLLAMPMRAPHIEVVKRPLPKTVGSGIIKQLEVLSGFRIWKKMPYDSQLQRLNDYRRIGPRWLADQKMKVLRHHDVSDHHKFVALAHLF